MSLILFSSCSNFENREISLKQQNEIERFHGGSSYGSWQISSHRGEIQDYIKSSKYKNEFQGLMPDTPSFDAEWREIANRDAEGFEEDQLEYVKQTHYIVQLNMLQNYGIDLSNRGFGVQEAVFSTSVQYGPKTEVIKKALKKENYNKLTDAEIIKAIQEEKRIRSAHNTPDMRQGLLGRISLEKVDLLNLVQEEKTNKLNQPSEINPGFISGMPENLTDNEKAEAYRKYGPPFEDNPYFEKKNYKNSEEDQQCINNAPSSFGNLIRCAYEEANKVVDRLQTVLTYSEKNALKDQNWFKNQVAELKNKCHNKFGGNTPEDDANESVCVKRKLYDLENMLAVQLKNKGLVEH